MSNYIIESKANQFRVQNGLGTNDPIRLKSFLSKLDCLVIFKPLSDEFSGMALKVEHQNQTNRFILINNKHSLGKQHFTICHEIYHLYIQNQFSSMFCKTGIFDKKDKEEFNADYFAAVFLLPETGVKSLIPDSELKKDGISLKTILKIEQYYSCSRAALLYRLQDLNLLSKDKALNYKDNIKLNALQYGYDTSLYTSGNTNLVIGNYSEIALRLYNEQTISETYYYTLLKDLGLINEQLQMIMNGKED